MYSAGISRFEPILLREMKFQIGICLAFNRLGEQAMKCFRIFLFTLAVSLSLQSTEAAKRRQMSFPSEAPLNSPSLSIKGEDWLRVQFSQKGKSHQVILLAREGQAWRELRTEKISSPVTVSTILTIEKKTRAQKQALITRQKFETDVLERKLSLYGIDPDLSPTALSQMAEISHRYDLLHQKLWLPRGEIIRKPNGSLILVVDRKEFLLLKDLNEHIPG